MLKELKQIIQKANPEIMELKRYCIFSEKGIKYEVLATVIYGIIGDVKAVRAYIKPNEIEIFTLEYFKEECKILGRPITLADVMIALERLEKYKAKLSFICINGCFYDEGVVVCQWDFKKDLDGQTKQMQEFLYKLLK